MFTEIFEQFPDSISVVTTELTDEGGPVSVAEVRDMVLESGMAKGAAISRDRLEDLVAELQAA